MNIICPKCEYEEAIDHEPVREFQAWTCPMCGTTIDLNEYEEEDDEYDYDV